MPSSGFVASFVLAQPKNSFPSCVGFVGASTFPSIILTSLVVSTPSNLPPFASNVTTGCSSV